MLKENQKIEYLSMRPGTMGALNSSAPSAPIVIRIPKILWYWENKSSAGFLICLVGRVVL